jgi:hypothetical protein
MAPRPCEHRKADQLLDPNNIGGARVREQDQRRRGGADRYLDICLRNVVKVQLATIQSAIDATPWPRQTGGPTGPYSKHW